MLNRVQRQLAQRLGCFVFGENARTLVHAHKPLRRGAVNHWRFMAPAMRVTVRDAVGRHQATRVSQGFQNVGNRFPDVLAAEQGEVGGIGAIALHRVQNLVVG